MKEKISCSLDGELLTRLDEVIKEYPFIGNRSAVIETACYMFIDSFDAMESFDLNEKITFCRESHMRDNVIRRLYERRCKLNAQKESEN